MSQPDPQEYDARLPSHAPLQGRAVDATHERIMGTVRNLAVGSAVLFAFLLATPLAKDTSALQTSTRVDYYIAFYSAALSLVFTLAPSVYPLSQWSQHGWSWHNQADRKWSARSVLVGMWFLGIAMAGSVYLVTDITLGQLPAIIAVTIMSSVTILAWFVPLGAAHLVRNRGKRPPRHARLLKYNAGSQVLTTGVARAGRSH